MHYHRTYQTRVSCYRGVERAVGESALSAYAELYSRLERKLFAGVAAGGPAAGLKSVDFERYSIPARMFNGVRVSLEGKMAPVREQQKLRLDDLTRRIARAERQVSDVDERVGRVRYTRRSGGLPICGSGWWHWKLTLRWDGWGFVSRRSGSGGSSTTLRITATAATMSSPKTGGMPAATSYSCWAVGTKQQAASCAWPPWLTTVL